MIASVSSNSPLQEALDTWCDDGGRWLDEADRMLSETNRLLRCLEEREATVELRESTLEQWQSTLENREELLQEREHLLMKGMLEFENSCSSPSNEILLELTRELAELRRAFEKRTNESEAGLVDEAAATSPLEVKSNMSEGPRHPIHPPRNHKRRGRR